MHQNGSPSQFIHGQAAAAIQEEKSYEQELLDEERFFTDEIPETSGCAASVRCCCPTCQGQSAEGRAHLEEY